VQNEIFSVLFNLRPDIDYRVVGNFLYSCLRIVKRACSRFCTLRKSTMPRFMLYFGYVGVDRSHLVTFFVISDHLKNDYHIKKSGECNEFPSLSNSLNSVTRVGCVNIAYIFLKNLVKLCYLATDQNSIHIEI
jgi:hypothetical protein